MESSSHRLRKISRLFISRLSQTNPFFIYILYFVSLSFLGFGILAALKPRTDSPPRSLDLLYTSVSAATISSMSVVEMEVFSNAQLVVITALMFVGGEVFTSLMILRLHAFRIAKKRRALPQNEPQGDRMELGIVKMPDDWGSSSSHESSNDSESLLKHGSVKLLCFVILVYLLALQILGIGAVLAYVALVSSAGSVLRDKGIKSLTFSVFIIVSTFASCGFVPTNENMVVFRRNPGLLLILIPQALLGNTLFPSALRGILWVVGKYNLGPEAKYLLGRGAGKIGYLHLLPCLHSLLLVATVLGFIFLGFVLFCLLEWNGVGLDGLNVYEKVVGIIFQCTNARHTGETIVDLSTIAPAVLVFFLVMMYLPPYTSFLPIEKDEQIPSKCEGKERKRNRVIQSFVFSQLSYLAIFIILICITERKSIKEDPINFSLLNITIEVISAYGNVGFTTGYSCERQLRADPKCVNKWYGLSGKWSDEGKIILIVVMLFGRLKQFNMNGGKAWVLL